MAPGRILSTWRHLPAIGSNLASQSRPGPVNILLMPMLHGCAFPGCSTFTLSTYCVEHELLVRALKESERAHHADGERAEDAPLTAETHSEATEPAAI
jgi:hypothetical protein